MNLLNISFLLYGLFYRLYIIIFTSRIEENCDDEKHSTSNFLHFFLIKFCERLIFNYRVHSSFYTSSYLSFILSDFTRLCKTDQGNDRSFLEMFAFHKSVLEICNKFVYTKQIFSTSRKSFWLQKSCS